MIRLRSLGRLHRLVTVGARHGLGYLTSRLMAEPAFRFLWRRPAQPPPDHVAAQRLAAALEELGPTYVKMGQFFSMRPDILPPVYIKALSRLHEHVRPVPFTEIRETIEKELGQPVGALFKRLSARPLAAASLAQVHEGELPDGSRVVVKVQRPDIRNIIRADLDILAELAVQVNRRIPEARVFRPTELVAEFRHQLTRELDFQLEAMRVERFRKHFRHDRCFYIPRVYWEHSSDRVLTLEQVTGTRPYAADLARDGLCPRQTAALLFQTFLREVLEFGSFHADPHPGNIFIRRDRICLFDFGIVGILTEPDRDILLDVIASLVTEDIDTLLAAFYRFRLIGPDINERLFRREIAGFFERYRGLPVRRVKVGEFLVDCIRLGRRFNVAFPTDLALLGKALIMIESLAATLDPDFEPLTAARPLIERIRAERLNPGFIYRRGLRNARRVSQGLAEMPALLFSIARKAESGQFRMHFLHEGLEGVTRELEGSLNRLAWAILLAAIIIAGTLLAINFIGR